MLFFYLTSVVLMIANSMATPSRFRRDIRPIGWNEDQTRFIPFNVAPIYVENSVSGRSEHHDEYGVPESAVSTSTEVPFVSVPSAPEAYDLPVPEISKIIVSENVQHDEYGPPALPPIIEVQHDEYGPPAESLNVVPPSPAIEPFPLYYPPVPEIITIEEPTTVYVAPYPAPTEAPTTTTTSWPYPAPTEPQSTTTTEVVTGKYPSKVSSHYEKDSGIFVSADGFARQVAVRRPENLLSLPVHGGVF